MPMPRRGGGRSRPRRPKAAAAASGFEETACATQVGLLGCDLLFHPLGLRLQVGEIFFQLVDTEAVEILGLRLLLARLQVVEIHGSASSLPRPALDRQSTRLNSSH